MERILREKTKVLIGPDYQKKMDVFIKTWLVGYCKIGDFSISFILPDNRIIALLSTKFVELGKIGLEKNYYAYDSLFEKMCTRNICFIHSTYIIKVKCKRK